MNNVGTAMYAEVYGRLVQRTAVRRRLMMAADDIRELARDEELNIDTVLGEAENALFGVTYQATGGDQMVHLSEAVSDYYDYVEYHMQHPESDEGIASGFRDVDELLTGFKPGQLIIVAGRPGMGKTAWALSMLANMARNRSRVGLFSLEMTIRDIVMRLISLEAGINLQRLSRVELSVPEQARFTEAVGRVADWPIYLYDKPRLSPTQLRMQASRMRHQYGLDAVIVDYAQLMEGEGYDRRTRQGDVSRRAKEMAKELNIPVIMLAQLNRNLESRKDKRPIMSDLKESGDFEQDADVILFLYRDSVYNDDSEFPGGAELIVAKQRNGPTGTLSLHFEKTLARFSNASVHRVNLADLE
jgi:replicative DNA helicase